MMVLDFPNDNRSMEIDGNLISMKVRYAVDTVYYTTLGTSDMLRVATAIRCETNDSSENRKWSLRVGTNDMLLVLDTPSGFTDVVIPMHRSAEVAKAIHDEVTSYANV